MKFSIYRFDPDKDATPYMRDYDIELEPADRMLLDALERIKTVDDSLSLRRSCREGVCGSDGYEHQRSATGSPALRSAHRIEGARGTAPLARPARDTRPDRGHDTNSSSNTILSSPISSIMTKLHRRTKRLQSPAERAEKLDGLYECILCACCSYRVPLILVEP